MMLRRIGRIGARAVACAILRCPLMRASWALRQFPFVAEQVPEEVVAPLRRRRGPNDFQAAADGVTALPGAEFAPPAEALLLDAGSFRLRSYQRRIARAVGFPKRMAARDQRRRFL